MKAGLCFWTVCLPGNTSLCMTTENTQENYRSGRKVPSGGQMGVFHAATRLSYKKCKQIELVYYSCDSLLFCCCLGDLEPES